MTVAEEAQRLADEGRVSIRQTTTGGTWAIVADEFANHLTVVYPYGGYFCRCPWGRVHSYTDDLCAHALALRLAVEREVSDD